MALYLDLDEEPINTTPMIDVVFNLLVFFMLSTTFFHEEQEMQVQLPRVVSAAPVTAAPDELVLDVLADGRVMLRGQALESAPLLARLKDARKNYPDQAVAVRGHRRVAYEKVMQVFAIAKQAGIQRVVARVLEER